MIRLSALALALGLAACATLAPPGPPSPVPAETTDSFAMADGVRLPYRAWLPAGGAPWAVALALHGMNDSRDAYEISAPALAAAGVAVFAPDQRGFGATATRGTWAGTAALVSDADAMARQLHARYPGARLFGIGESMGAAVLMLAATSPDPPPLDGYILVAPAVWGRAKMNLLQRTTLSVAARLIPGYTIGRVPGLRIWASSNRDAIVRLSRDPLTLKRTRVDAVRGLVDLMDAALASAQRFTAPALFLYGAHDQLVPKRATLATWRALPPGPRRAFYPDGWHLLLRDTARADPIGDALAWMRDRSVSLPSGAEQAAETWLGQQR